MGDNVIIPEIYIKEEPVENESEKKVGDYSEDPFQSAENLTPSEARVVGKADDSARQSDNTTPSSPEIPLSNVENEGEEEGQEEQVVREDDSQKEVDVAEDTGAASIFEPEVNILSEDEDVQCNLEGGYTSNEEDHLNKKKLSSVSKNFDYEKKHQCPLCGKFFLTSSAMNGHVAKGHGTTLGLKFTCHVCGAPGSSRASLKRHLIRTHKVKTVDHPELLTKKCVHCSIGLSSHLLLYEHIRSEHSEKLHEYHNCNWCPALMRAKASLIRHIRRTHPDKEEPLLTSEKCSHCEECFSSRFLLQRHVKSSHPNAPPTIKHDEHKKSEETRKKKRYSVECEYCGRKFGSKPRLQYHIEVVHTNPPIKIYTCRMCGLTFPTAKQNNRHYRKVHRPERQKIHCGKCNITFSTPEECSKHRAIHPNTCEVCQKQFLRRDSLREHLLIHSAPRHQCPHCTKKFTQRSNLKRHIRVHTGEKPYKCTFCSRCFSDKSACNSHIRVHTGYERSVCSVCGASFSKKQRLNYHMRMHTGEGLLYCPLCVRPSTNSYSLRKHIESHQQPLTKALTSIGFRPLLVSDPNFVMRALQALTHATLQNISRHENIPNSFKEELEELNGTTIMTGVSSAEEKDVDECAKSLSNIGGFKADVPNEDPEEEKPSASASRKSGVPEEVKEEEEEEDSPFNLTKFLQGLLEKESLKVRTDRRNRKDRRLRRNSLRSTHHGASARGFEDERESDEEELPTTIGDELVKQCLEIIMKDEPVTDDEEEYENGMYSDEEEAQYHRMECNQITTEFVIKSEPPDDFDFDSEQLDPLLDEGDFKSLQGKGIPKIKISRIAKNNSDSNEDVFVAEIVKKN